MRVYDGKPFLIFFISMFLKILRKEIRKENVTFSQVKVFDDNCTSSHIVREILMFSREVTIQIHTHLIRMFAPFRKSKVNK